jgi:hypothetical protein
MLSILKLLRLLMEQRRKVEEEKNRGERTCKGQRQVLPTAACLFQNEIVLRVATPGEFPVIMSK